MTKLLTLQIDQGLNLKWMFSETFIVVSLPDIIIDLHHLEKTTGFNGVSIISPTAAPGHQVFQSLT